MALINYLYPVVPAGVFCSFCGGRSGVNSPFPAGVAYSISFGEPAFPTPIKEEIHGYVVEGISLPLSNNRFLNFKTCSIPDGINPKAFKHVTVKTVDYDPDIGSWPGQEDVKNIYIAGLNYAWLAYGGSKEQENFKNALKGKHICVVYSHHCPNGNADFDRLLETFPKYDVVFQKNITNRLYSDNTNYLTLKVLKFHD